MAWVNQDKCAIVGVGATPYYVRGQSHPRTLHELGGAAIIAACEDAGIDVPQLDGFAYYAGDSAGSIETLNTVLLMETLGIPECTFSAALTGGGGTSAAAVGLATAALMNGEATYVVCVMALQQGKQRLGSVYGDKAANSVDSFTQPAGLIGPGYLLAPLVRRHMYLYGTRREAFCEVAMLQRENAMNRPGAIRRQPLSKEQYFASPMLADPMCRLDFCLETDGAIAFIVTTAERAKDLRQKPAYIHACAHGGRREWGRAFSWMGMPDPVFGSSGHKPVADRLWRMAGLGPQDIDVAQIYDNFSPVVVMQMEDYGFCAKGEGGVFVESGALRFKTGSLPTNTHGGQLSEAYIIGATHVREGVEQMRGTATNQVEGAEVTLVTGGPGAMPVSALILRN